jgi:hypothetical protein
MANTSRPGLTAKGMAFVATVSAAIRLHKDGHYGMSAEVESFIETLVNCCFPLPRERDVVMDVAFPPNKRTK